MTTTERTALQEELAGLRARGYTMSSIARHLGVRRGAVQRWWDGTRQPRFETMVMRSLGDLRDAPPPRRRRVAGGRDGK